MSEEEASNTPIIFCSGPYIEDLEQETEEEREKRLEEEKKEREIREKEEKEKEIKKLEAVAKHLGLGNAADLTFLAKGGEGEIYSFIDKDGVKKVVKIYNEVDAEKVEESEKLYKNINKTENVSKTLEGTGWILDENGNKVCYCEVSQYMDMDLEDKLIKDIDELKEKESILKKNEEKIKNIENSLERSQKLKELENEKERLKEKRKELCYNSLKICSKIASTIAKFHENGMAHRDIKLNNVLFSEKGSKVAVSDFGYTVDVKSKNGKTIDPMGSPGYMSPELCKEYDGITGRIGPQEEDNKINMGNKVIFTQDIYAMSIMFYMLVTGNKEIMTNFTKAWAYVYKIDSIQKERLELLENSKGKLVLPFENPEISEKFVNLIFRGIATNPKDRPTAEEMDEVINDIILLVEKERKQEKEEQEEQKNEKPANKIPDFITVQECNKKQIENNSISPNSPPSNSEPKNQQENEKTEIKEENLELSDFPSSKPEIPLSETEDKRMEIGNTNIKPLKEKLEKNKLDSNRLKTDEERIKLSTMTNDVRKISNENEKTTERSFS